MWRLTAQWPALELDQRTVTAAVDQALRTQSPGHRATPQEIEAFQIALCTAIRDINPWFYDVDPGAIRAALPGIAPPTGAPGDAVIEEPLCCIKRGDGPVPSKWRRFPS